MSERQKKREREKEQLAVSSQVAELMQDFDYYRDRPRTQDNISDKLRMLLTVYPEGNSKLK